MSENSNKLIRFWQELKRRKVFSVVTTYVATAYIIIEVTNNIVSPLRLPAWIPSIIILLLIAGLPVVIILSWIFDFTPQGLRKTESLEELESKKVVKKPVKRKLRASYVLNAVLIIAVIILAYPKVFKRDTLEKLRSSGERISVAVMPFMNLTNDTTLTVWEDGIQNNIITSLSNVEELKIRQRESIKILLQNKGLINYSSITPSLASNISRKLDANIFIYGSFNIVNNTIRVNAQLINSKTKDVYKSFRNEGNIDDILQIIDSLSTQLENFLVMSKLIKDVTSDFQPFGTTKSVEAYRNFIYGQNAVMKGDYSTAFSFLSQATDIDPNFIYSSYFLAWTFMFDGKLNHAKDISTQLYANRDQVGSHEMKMLVCYQYAFFFETPFEQIKYLTQLLRINDQLPFSYHSLGAAYDYLYQYDKAIPEYKKALMIYKKWGVKPEWIYYYLDLGFAYHNTGQYREEKKLYKKTERDFPDDPYLIYRQAVLALTLRKTNSAKEYIEKYISKLEDNSTSEAGIVTRLTGIYFEAGIFDKAEIYLRKAISLEPDNPWMLFNLASFLIEQDRNIDEGLELVDKVLNLKPNDYSVLQCKGLGLYKQGKYEEALDFLQRSWDLRMKDGIYIHSAYLNLEAAKKAVAELKNN